MEMEQGQEEVGKEWELMPRDLKTDLKYINDLCPVNTYVAREAITRAIAAEELCAAFREELAHKHNLLNDYKLDKDKLEEENDLQRASIQNLSCQVAGLREGLYNALAWWKGWYIASCKQQGIPKPNINTDNNAESCCYRCTAELLSSPDPGEKIRNVVEAAKMVVKPRGKEPYSIHENHIDDMKKLRQAVADLKEGD